LISLACCCRVDPVGDKADQAIRSGKSIVAALVDVATVELVDVL
jgi:hypothetical protein